MATYQLRTFEDIFTAMREEMQVSSTDTTAIIRMKRDINIVYQEITAKKNWKWLEASTTLQLPGYLDTGTLSVTGGSADITFSDAPVASQVGRWLSVGGFHELYIIESHTAGATTAKLTELYGGETSTTATYKLFSDRIALPTDCKEVSEIYHQHQTNALEGKGKKDLRKLFNMAPLAEGAPCYYYAGGFQDPSGTAAITSIPASATRASAGVVKTIKFAATLPTALITAVSDGDPVRIRVSEADSPSYNGDFIISSISTTSAANDTITYTGKSALTESATSDTGISVRQISHEVDYDRFRELFLYPCLSEDPITLHLDFTREVFPLEDNDDEPILPLQDRSLLLYMALHRAWSRARNPEEAARNLGLGQQKLADMAGKLTSSFDSPKLQISNLYLRSKRRKRSGYPD